MARTVPEMPTDILKDALRSMMERAGVNQTDLGYAVGITNQAVSQHLHGRCGWDFFLTAAREMGFEPTVIQYVGRGQI